jgi:S-adenosylmethionine-diacylgycerolhomoserine-N-methlytransferase
MPLSSEVSGEPRLLKDLTTLYHLMVKRMRGATPQERLNNFYKGQESNYDRFRERMLFGRSELFNLVPVNSGSVWVDMGGGTGSNYETLGHKMSTLGKAYVVDLCEPLLSMAEERKKRNEWTNMEVIHGDASTFTLPDHELADVVSFSYSLTMIPSWYAAIDHALEILKPGGCLAVCDFFIAHPFLLVEKQEAHSRLTRTFWRAWFETDGVFPSSDHVPYLTRKVEVRHYSQHRGKAPYLPFASMPYYLFLGTKLE